MEHFKIILLIIFTVIISWEIGFLFNKKTEIKETSKLYLSYEEAKIALASSEPLNDKTYYWQQDLVIIVKKTIIPFVTSKDTIYKSDKELKSKNYRN